MNFKVTKIFKKDIFSILLIFLLKENDFLIKIIFLDKFLCWIRKLKKKFRFGYLELKIWSSKVLSLNNNSSPAKGCRGKILCLGYKTTLK